MMVWSAVIWLFVLNFKAVISADTPVYEKKDAVAVLSPGPMTTRISTITWKHGDDIAMDWYNNVLDPYRQFKDRGHLNTSTGTLTIKGLQKSDSGHYTVEINSNVTNKIELLVISPVSKPNISEKCDPETCVFTCKGNTADSEPISYRWTLDDKTINSAKALTVRKEQGVHSISCALINPVSYESSDKVDNPLRPKNASRTNLWWLILLAILVILCVGVTVWYFTRRRREQRMDVDKASDEGAAMLKNVTPTSDDNRIVNQHPGANNVTDGPPTTSELPGTPSQDPETENEAEGESITSNGQVTSVQDKPREDQAAEQPDDHQTPPQHPDANSITERSTTVPELQDTSGQRPETSNETATSAMSASHGQETANADHQADQATETQDGDQG